MGIETRSMYTGIGSAGTNHLNCLAEDGAQSMIEYLLHTQGLGLYLPAMVIGALKCQFDKISMNQNLLGLEQN